MITGLLKAWGRGDSAAIDRLMPLIYQELHRLADRYMRWEHPAHTLQATALVNEAFVRLVDARTVDWQDRAHFFCRGCAHHATHPRRWRPSQGLVETRRPRAARRPLHSDQSRSPAGDACRSARAVERARRCAQHAGTDGFTTGASSGATLLRRAHRRRDWTRLENVAAKRHARLEAGARVAGARAQSLT
jgi:hypothetical protein